MKISKKHILPLFLTFLLITNCSTSVIEKELPPVAKITYTARIKPIVQANCTKTCHSPASQIDAGLDLSTFAALKLGTESRGVIARMKDASNPMPPQPSPRVSDANIVLFEKWVTDGYLEN